MSNQVYLALPGGTLIGDEYIVPVTMTGRQSGHYLLVTLPYGTNQWVHIDNILFEDEVS